MQRIALLGTRPKIDKKFLKEFFLMVFIIVNTFLLQLHVLVKDDMSKLSLLNVEIIHGYPSNQYLAWTLLSYLQPLMLTALIYFFVERRFKYAFLFLAYWLQYSILFALWGEGGNIEVMKIMKNSCILVLLIPLLLSMLFRKFGLLSFPRQAKYRQNDFLIAVFIIFLPFLEKLIWYIPWEQKVVEYAGYKIDSGEWGNLISLFKFVIIKMYFFVPCLVLFFTVKRWWRYSLLVPILMIVFQLRNGIDSKVEYVDEFEVLEAAPLLISVLMLLLLLSKSAFYQSKMAQLYKTTYNHLEMVIRRKFKVREHFLSQTKTRWNKMKNSNTVDEEELFQLKQHLEQELQKYGH